MTPVVSAASPRTSSPRTSSIPPALPRTPSSPHLPHRVLVVDDCADQRLIIRKVLERSGITVDEASSGFEGLKLYDKARRQGTDYEVVLMDLRMPGMDGMETTRRMLGRKAAVRPRVVGVTAEPHEAFFAACRSAGMEAIVSKPFRAGSLLVACMKRPCA
ncbi:MAG: response regulator [Bacteroidota bacterium]